MMSLFLYKIKEFLIVLTLLASPQTVFCQQAAPAAGLDSVSVRVIDVDNGLCSFIRLPGNKYVIYDAGGPNTADGKETWGYMQQFLPAGSTIELMILSHMDGDHIVAASQAILGYNIKKVIWGGYDRKIDGSDPTETAAFTRLKNALHDRRTVTESINLHERDSVIYPGGDINISGVHFKLLCGFGKPLPEWHLTVPAERLNGVSIVMKMEYGSNSVLFTGDALGRRSYSPETTCIATEKFLVDRVGDGLQSTVMFSPHHGAENGSSKTFLDKVKPQYIIIPAGHASFLHPRKSTCLRYLNYVTKERIFRTDRGDDQGEKEWDYLRIPHCKDKAGDDDIQIDMRSDNKLHVYYLNPVNVCATL
jgi:competence protein ComEC